MDFPQYRSCSQGFTLLEMLAVSTMVGILAVIAVPSWVAFLQQQDLSRKAEAVDLVFRQAQALAKKNNQSYIVEFQNKNGLPQYSIYTTNATSPPWQNLTETPNRIQLNLAQGTKIIFNHDGSVDDLSPITVDEKITLSLVGASQASKRCVIVRTLLGVTDIGRNEACN